MHALVLGARTRNRQQQIKILNHHARQTNMHTEPLQIEIHAPRHITHAQRLKTIPKKNTRKTNEYAHATITNKNTRTEAHYARSTI